MLYIRQVCFKINRFLIVFCATLLYLFLIGLDACVLFAQNVQLTHPFLWLSFGFFSLTALLFLAVGALVWFYARNRSIATRLLGLYVSLMACFAVEAGLNGNPGMRGYEWLDVISTISGVIALPLFLSFLWIFPKYNHISLYSSPANVIQSSFKQSYFTQALWISRLYLSFINVCSIVLSVVLLFSITSPFIEPAWLILAVVGYYLIGFSGILLSVVSSYLKAQRRERQQLRLFVGGVVFSIAPTLFLYLLPQLIGLPPRYVIDSSYTLITFFVFPLALGYSILRYQILVLDNYARRAVAFIVGSIFLFLLTFVIIFAENAYLAAPNANPQHFFVYAVIFICLMAVTAPLAWWAARTLTEHFFFSDMLYYRRLINRPASIADEKLDIDYAANLFISAAIETFEITQAGLFVLDEGSGYYRFTPILGEGRGDLAREVLLQTLLQKLDVVTTEGDVDWIGAHLPAMERLAAARRPLLLSEAMKPESERPKGLNRYFTDGSTLGEDDWLLAPVRVQGTMIGVLVLGERGDRQPYAGPDFEIVGMLLARFSSILETARLNARANQHAALLNSLYSITTQPGYIYKDSEDVVRIYAGVASVAAQARAEIWLYDEPADMLRYIVAAGAGPRITEERPTLQLAAASDWQAAFFVDGQIDDSLSSASLPGCLVTRPSASFGWLPLLKSERRWGLLILSYPRPHLFMKEEMRVLEMFASQCVAALENMRMNTELLAAYEQQKELDALKDRFIMTASHEMRTPLTAVVGYIELLKEYNATLPLEARADFIDKAQQGCEDLTLLVGNIMDASRVNIDADNVKIKSVALLESVKQILEMLETVITSEKRVVEVKIAEDICVRADNIRLPQVLLNLLHNTLQYSQVGSRIEISAVCVHDEVVLSIRDYGYGVPLDDQKRIFERFMRLDRDMNSLVRGAGLGLAVCKQLVEAMGGRIWVESSGQEGHGSCFLFALPLDSSKREQVIEAVQLQYN